MKLLQTSIFRALCSIVVGALLIANPDSTVTWLTVAVGVLFLVSGVISCAAYLCARRAAAAATAATVTDAQGRPVGGARPLFPIVGVGSILLGLLLALAPAAFVKGLMYVLGALMVLGAAGQYMALVGARRIGLVGPGLWICPTLVLLTGLYVLLQPMESASLPLVILGWCSVVYGVAEIMNVVKIHALRKAWERANQQLEPPMAEAEEVE